MRPQRRISWDELKELVTMLGVDIKSRGAHYSGVFGIPTGGAVVALLLAPRLGIPLHDLPQDGTLIVDDICDSGKTLEQYGGAQTAVLHVRHGSTHIPTHWVEETEQWVLYPYERGDGVKQLGGEEVITRMIQLLGDDPTREGLVDTPGRVVRAWKELFAGYSAEPPSMAAFDEKYDEMVLARDLAFTSHCEHHILPFFGVAHVAYIPNGKVLGLSKIARVVEYYARRLQLQERLTQEIADFIQTTLSPTGVGVVIQAQHLCMIARGVRQAQGTITTSAVRGALKEEGPARHEFLALMRDRP